MSSPFRRVVDDLTAGCGCACHTGIGYNTACEHCRPGQPAILLRDDEAGVERLVRALDAIADRGNDLPNSVRLARAIIAALWEGR